MSECFKDSSLWAMPSFLYFYIHHYYGAEPIKFVWSYDFHHQKILLQCNWRLQNIQTLALLYFCNNKQPFWYLWLSSIQQSKLEFWAFSICKNIIYLWKLFKIPLTQCHGNLSITWQLLHSCLKQILSQFSQTFPHFSNMSAAQDYIQANTK